MASMLNQNHFRCPGPRSCIYIFLAVDTSLGVTQSCLIMCTHTYVATMGPGGWGVGMVPSLL